MNILSPLELDFLWESVGAGELPRQVSNNLVQTMELLKTTTGLDIESLIQKYASTTGHAYGVVVVLVSRKLWDKLSEDERKILQEAASEATVYQRQVAREQAEKALDEIAKSGMEINELPPEEIAKLREKAGPVIEKFRKEIGEELVTELYAEIDKVRKN